MAFKADSSFLRYVTMGALGVRRTIALLQNSGFQPIELERYATSNKIWATKIKRLRLPDIICIRTGLRVEVRTKTALSIKMSDAPNNPDRVWHAGLRDDDVVAFLAASETDGSVLVADTANFFEIGSLKATEPASRLGAAKSAGEGAERDRVWPSYVSKVTGSVVREVAADTGSASATHLELRLTKPSGGTKRYLYPLKGKAVYAQPGEGFVGGESILAGVLPARADIRNFLNRVYDPIAGLGSAQIVDRFAAIKVLPYRADIHASIGQGVVVSMLEQHIADEADIRVRLEAAASATSLGSSSALNTLTAFLESSTDDELRMEAILILSEQRTGLLAAQAAHSLAAVVQNRSAPSELRQAAVWGLGFSGHRDFSALLPYLNDDDENVALHAIAAFGADVTDAQIAQLANCLDERTPQLAAAASEALRLIDSDAVVAHVMEACLANPSHRTWAVVTLGRLDPNRVRALVTDPEILTALAPVIRAFSAENWMARGERLASLAYLLKQRC